MLRSQKSFFPSKKPSQKKTQDKKIKRKRVLLLFPALIFRHYWIHFYLLPARTQFLVKILPHNGEH